MKLKFAIVCPHHGYIHRGNETMTSEVKRVLLRRGHKVDIYSLDKSSDVQVSGIRKDSRLGHFTDFISEKTLLGGFTRKYIGFEPPFEGLVFALNLYPVLEKNRNLYDIIWSNGEYWCALMLNKLRKKYKLRTINFFGGGISKMMESEARLYPDVFSVLTPFMESWVQSKVPDCNVKFIPCGVRNSLFKPSLPPMFDPASYEHPMVASTSALIPSKRVDVIIRAMADIGKGTLFVTNTGPLQNNIVSLGKKLLGDRFHYLGVIPFDKLPNLYNSVDVICMASRREPYGFVLLEAMACNTPVIAERDQTREWMVGEGGILIGDGSNPKEISDAIKTVVNTDFNDKPKFQAEKFSWSRTVDAYEEAIKELE